MVSSWPSSGPCWQGSGVDASARGGSADAAWGLGLRVAWPSFSGLPPPSPRRRPPWPPDALASRLVEPASRPRDRRRLSGRSGLASAGHRLPGESGSPWSWPVLQGSGRLDPGGALPRPWPRSPSFDLAAYHRSPNPTAPLSLYKGAPGDRGGNRGASASLPCLRLRLQRPRERTRATSTGDRGLSSSPACPKAFRSMPRLLSACRWRWPPEDAGPLGGFSRRTPSTTAASTPRPSRAPGKAAARGGGDSNSELRLHQAGGVDPRGVVPRPRWSHARATRLVGLFERPILLEPRAGSPAADVCRRPRRDRAGNDAGAGGTPCFDPGFDLRGDVALAEGEERVDAPAGPAGTSRLLEEHADRVVLEADLERARTRGMLDGYDPGWKARGRRTGGGSRAPREPRLSCRPRSAGKAPDRDGLQAARPAAGPGGLPAVARVGMYMRGAKAPLFV